MEENPTKKTTKKKTATPSEDFHGRVQPQAVDFEEALLGAALLEQNAAGRIIDRLTPQMFYREEHQIIYNAIREIIAESKPVDLLSVTEKLRKRKELDLIGGSYYLAYLTNKVVSSANIEYHARIISEKYIQRELISVATNIIHDAFEDRKDVLDMLDSAETDLFQIAENNFKRGNFDMKDLIKDFMDELSLMRNREQSLRGIPSGFTKLDSITSGWQKSALMILAARPGMGKTAFVLSMARNMTVERKIPVAFFSLEMSASDLVMRLVSSEASISQTKLKNAKITEAEMQNVLEKIQCLSDAPLYIDDTPGLNVFDLRAKCRRMKQQHQIECVIIDYLQLMSGGKELKGNREQEISMISRSLKTLAKELEIPVIALSQLNRSVETRSTVSKRPQLSDLRESGAIEQDADMVMFIYRPEYYNVNEFEDGVESKGLADLIIAKHRNGSIGDVRLRFLAEQAKFDDYIEGVNPSFSSSQDSIIISSRINEENNGLSNMPF